MYYWDTLIDKMIDERLEEMERNGEEFYGNTRNE